MLSRVSGLQLCPESSEMRWNRGLHGLRRAAGLHLRLSLWGRHRGGVPLHQVPTNPLLLLNTALHMKDRARIQYICLVPIYVFPGMKLRRLVIFKTELHIMFCLPISTFMYTCERFYIPRIGLPILLQPMGTNKLFTDT